jgi:hypothetical protein
MTRAYQLDSATCFEFSVDALAEDRGEGARQLARLMRDQNS